MYCETHSKSLNKCLIEPPSHHFLSHLPPALEPSLPPPGQAPRAADPTVCVLIRHCVWAALEIRAMQRLKHRPIGVHVSNTGKLL